MQMLKYWLLMGICYKDQHDHVHKFDIPEVLPTAASLETMPVGGSDTGSGSGINAMPAPASDSQAEAAGRSRAKSRKH